VFTVDATNFALTANGTATIKNATITDGRITSSSSGTGFQTVITGGEVVATTNNNETCSLNPQEIYIENSSSTTTIITAASAMFGGNARVYGNATVDGSLTVGGSSVLTSVPTTVALSTITNTSNNDRIRIDDSGSNYNLVLNGSVNIGNGSSNTIRIKGRDVKWVAYSSLTSSDYVLVEA